MTTRYSQSSGNWNTAARWNTAGNGSGSSGVPVDGDSVRIQSGHSIVLDVDLTAWASGITNLIIEGGVTPGMLSFKSDADGTYGLKILSNSTLQGTTSTNRGRLLLGGGTWGSPSALPSARKHIISLAGTTTPAKIDASNLDIQATCAEPTIKGLRTYSQISSVVSVDPGTDTITLSATVGTYGWTANTPLRITSSGTLPAPLEENVTYYLVSSGGGTNIQLKAFSSTMPTIDLTTAGSGTIRVYDGVAASVTAGATINVLDDVTGDPAWSTAAGHNAVSFVSELPAAYDQQRNTITAINAGTITLGANTTSVIKGPGSRIWLSSRNVSIQCSGTASSTGMIDWGSTGDFQNPQPINLELRNTAGSGTTTYGSGFVGGGAAGAGNTFGGTICGVSYGIGYGSQNHGNAHTFNGVAISCASLINGGQTGGTINGSAVGCTTVVANTWATPPQVTFSASSLIAGCTTVLGAGSQGCRVLGTIVGCQYGTGSSAAYGNEIGGTVRNVNTVALTGPGTLISGDVRGCQYVTSGSTSARVTGTLVGNQFGIYYSAGVRLDGCTIREGGQAIYGGSGVLANATLSGNNTADVVGVLGSWVGRASSLRSSTQVASYKTGVQSGDGWQQFVLYDICDSNQTIQPGQLKAWMPGGTVASITAAIPANFPGPQSYVHRMLPESQTINGVAAYFPCFVDIPIAASAGVPLNITVWIQKDAHAMQETPKAQLIDPNKPWGDASEALAAATMADTENDWQTLTLAYTPDHDESLALRVRCKNGSGAAYWNYSINRGRSVLIGA